MARFYVLTILETQKEYAYSSITALCMVHPREELRVSLSQLTKVLSENSTYRNRYIKVVKYNAYSTGDIRKGLHLE